MKCFSESRGCSGHLFLNRFAQHTPNIRISLQEPQTFEVQIRVRNKERYILPLEVKYAIPSKNAPLLGWTHVAVVYNEHGLKLYLNGTIAARKPGVRGGTFVTCFDFVQTYIATTLPDQKATLGQFNGYIDELQVFSKALTRTQVAMLRDNEFLASQYIFP